MSDGSSIANEYHKLFYDNKLWYSKWMGQGILKYPSDLMIYQEIIWDVKPELIIECGTYAGGTTLFLAHMLDLLGDNPISIVMSIDPYDHPPRREHPRIKYIQGSSTEYSVVQQIEKEKRNRWRGGYPVPTLVILDSDHSAPHVLNELKLYSPFVSVGSYIIVEDSNVNGHPVFPDHGPGPMEAMAEWWNTTDAKHFFRVDHSREHFLISANPNGFIQRTK